MKGTAFDRLSLIENRVCVEGPPVRGRMSMARMKPVADVPPAEKLRIVFFLQFSTLSMFRSGSSTLSETESPTIEIIKYDFLLFILF